MSHRILVVDDDRSIVELTSRVLRREGFTVENAGRGEDAIASVTENPPHILLLDYQLPDMNAEEVVEALARLNASVPFIVMTGQGREEVAVKMMKLGARDYLTKNTVMVELLPSVVKEVVSRIETEEVLAAAEKELKAGEERFTLLMQTMKEGLVIQDEKGLISFVNEKFCFIAGYRCGDLLGQPLSIFLDRLEGDGGGEKIEGPATFEATVKGGSGKNVRLEVTTRELYDSQGRSRGSYSVFTDVTELRQLQERIQLAEGFEGMVGRDVLMRDLFEMIREASSCDYPVLIQGESGTGKELAAIAIHNLSSRTGERFVPLNCGVLMENLVESELFGHVEGAFTGAIRAKKGRVEIAHRGTLFLDEIGDLSPHLQVKFLRFLQEGTFERLGAENTSRVDVRVISATNRDLRREVEEGRFREDLFFRLSTFPITVPPLRERPADIPLLIDHIIRKAAARMQRKPVSISLEAAALMTSYRWPGNIRELENVIMFSLIKSKNRTIEIGHLPANITRKSGTPSPRRGRKAKVSAREVKAALEQTGGNMSAAARKLGISRATIYRVAGR